MRRPALLVISQVLLLLLGLAYPILFVRYNGHALFGAVALAANYSAVILSVLVTGFSQSILSDGLAFARLRTYVAGLSAVAMLGWAAEALIAPSAGAGVYLAVAWVLAAQSATSFVYYFAVRRRQSFVLTLVMPGEALVRLVALVGFHALGLSGAVVLIGSYVVSNVIASVAGLVAIAWFAPRPDPDAAAALQLSVAGRFMRWAASGVLLDSFDRVGYGALLSAGARSPFFFFDTLYLTAFGLIANTARMEVLSARPGGAVASRPALLMLTIGGVAAAAAATWGLFALGAPLGRWTGFDPRPSQGSVLYAFGYRAALFIQFVAFAYIERAGRTRWSTLPRLVASIALIGLIAASGLVSPDMVALVSLAIATLIAVLSLGLALWRDPMAALGPNPGEA